MESEPLVSILIPVYNVESFLRECLDSVVHQTYSNLQIVLVDDGSTDRSWDIMQAYAKIDTRIEIYHQTNKGVSATRNHLLEKVKGDYVLFVDSDDWIEANTIENCINEVKDKHIDIYIFNAKNNSILYQEEVIKLFLEHCEFRGMLWNKFIKRDLFQKHKFDEKICYGEDALMIWALLQNSPIVLLSNKQFYHYRIHDSNISKSSFNENKFSAYYVWRQICSEVESYWPQYQDIAHARYAIEMTLLLRDALNSKFDNLQIITCLRKIIIKYRRFIKKTNISSKKMRVYTYLISHFYPFFRIIQ